MQFVFRRLGVLVPAGVLMLGCGGSQPPAESAPPAVTAAPTAPVPEPASSATAATTAAPAPSAAPTAEPAPAAEPIVPLEDRLFAASVAFMIRFDDSAPKQSSNVTCAKTENDPEAHSKCMDKERERFLADVLVFRKNDKGMTMTVYRRQGNNLQELSKSVVVLGEHLPMQVSFAVKSDHGTRPIFAGRKEVQVSATPESTSNIEVHDPKLGKLVYEARIGLVNE